MSLPDSPSPAPQPPPLPVFPPPAGGTSLEELRQSNAALQRQAIHAAQDQRYTAATTLLEAQVAGKSGRTSSQKALLLMLSLAAFVLWLSFRGDGGDTTSALIDGAILIAILFFHELGHFFAMKIFGYKDLSMFFIPFFGAAVTGRKLHVQAWQDAIMTLAGPLPGIILGVPLYFYGRMNELDLMKQTGFLMLIINAINLLPIKPLDGGRFFETILFSRWRWLSLLFSAFSMAGFALFLIYIAAWSPIIVGLFTLFQIMVAYKRWKVLRTLEQQAPEAILAPDGTWPADQARPMFEAIDAANAPTQLQPRHLAAFALQHLQRQTTTPPRIAATLGLLVLYAFPLLYLLIGAYFWTSLQTLETK